MVQFSSKDRLLSYMTVHFGLNGHLLSRDRPLSSLRTVDFRTDSYDLQWASFSRRAVWILTYKISYAIFKNPTIDGHKVIETFGLKHLSSSATFFQILILGTQS